MLVINSVKTANFPRLNSHYLYDGNVSQGIGPLCPWCRPRLESEMTGDPLLNVGGNFVSKSVSTLTVVYRVSLYGSFLPFSLTFFLLPSRAAIWLRLSLSLFLFQRNSPIELGVELVSSC
jgi:hypothetical protein